MNITFRTGIIAGLVCLGIGIGIGTWATIALSKPKIITVKAEPQINLPNGAKALAVVPDANAKPAHALPAGAKANRTGDLIIQPLPTILDPIPANPGGPISNALPRVLIDWTLADMPDGSQRMIFSSPDAEIVGGIDHPVQATRKIESDLVHAVGWHIGRGSDGTKRYGPSYEFDWKRIRLGADLSLITRPTIRNEIEITWRILYRIRGASH